MAAAALRALKGLLEAASDDALVLRCARSEQLLSIVEWVANDAVGVLTSGSVPAHEAFTSGVPNFVLSLFSLSTAAAGALGASPAMPAAAAALLRLAAADGDSVIARETASLCLGALVKSPAVSAATAHELALSMVAVLRSGSEVERVCVCSALVASWSASDANCQLPAPLTALLAERGLAAALVSALRRPGQCKEAALAAAAALGEFAIASNLHAAVRPVAGAISSLTAADAAAVGALARVADYCVVRAPPPGEHKRIVNFAAAAFAATSDAGLRPPLAAGLAAGVARWLARAATACCELPSSNRPEEWHLVQQLVCCVMSLIDILAEPSDEQAAAVATDTTPSPAPLAATKAAACAMILQGAPELPGALARIVASPPPLPHAPDIMKKAAVDVMADAQELLGLLGCGDVSGGAAQGEGPCCAHCGQAEDAPAGLTLKRCGGCRSRHYCGAECAKAAWAAGHRAECKQLAAAGRASLAKVE